MLYGGERGRGGEGGRERERERERRRETGREAVPLDHTVVVR